MKKRAWFFEMYKMRLPPRTVRFKVFFFWFLFLYFVVGEKLFCFASSLAVFFFSTLVTRLIVRFWTPVINVQLHYYVRFFDATFTLSNAIFEWKNEPVDLTCVLFSSVRVKCNFVMGSHTKSIERVYTSYPRGSRRFSDRNSKIVWPLKISDFVFPFNLVRMCCVTRSPANSTITVVNSALRPDKLKTINRSRRLVEIHPYRWRQKMKKNQRLSG